MTGTRATSILIFLTEQIQGGHNIQYTSLNYLSALIFCLKSEMQVSELYISKMDFRKLKSWHPLTCLDYPFLQWFFYNKKDKQCSPHLKLWSYSWSLFTNCWCKFSNSPWSHSLCELDTVHLSATILTDEPSRPFPSIGSWQWLKSSQRGGGDPTGLWTQTVSFVNAPNHIKCQGLSTDNLPSSLGSHMGYVPG